MYRLCSCCVYGVLWNGDRVILCIACVAVVRAVYYGVVVE